MLSKFLIAKSYFMYPKAKTALLEHSQFGSYIKLTSTQIGLNSNWGKNWNAGEVSKGFFSFAAQTNFVNFKESELDNFLFSHEEK
jgi:hypothetical protein